jgi:hypothetical protein
MASAAAAARTRASSAPARWLFGGWSDLLLGCGLLYAALFAGLLVFGKQLRLAQPEIAFSLAFLAVSIPHYGATLLRVYERARDRRAYAVFSVWITLALAGAFVGALYSPALGTFLATLYFTWSPWHYTGQNYGLAVMFLRRSGVEIAGVQKRWLYASFVLSFALVTLVVHGSGVVVRGAGQYGGAAGIGFAPLGIPAGVVNALAPALCAAQLGALAVSAIGLLRRASLRALAPVLALWLAQTLWFTLPYAALHFSWFRSVDALDWRFNAHYFMWIALSHAAQYLWVTAYFARQSGAHASLPEFWAKALAAGALVWTLPLLVFWQPGFAVLSPDSGILLLVAAVANLHHFILDGAIWKLRGRIAQVLIQSQPEERDEPSRTSWLGRATWAMCGVALAANLAGIVLDDAWKRAVREGDFAGARALLASLHWVGHDRASYRLALARGMLKAGAAEAARAEATVATEAEPSPESWAVLAQAHLALGRSADAARALEAASALAPDSARFPRDAARAWRAAGERERALAQLERAAALAPGDASVARELARLRSAEPGAARSAIP